MPICLCCHEYYGKENFIRKERVLCEVCFNKLNGKLRKDKKENMPYYYFYDYEGLFQELLLQYKECYDEALAPIFLNDYLFKLELIYKNYYLVLMPSTDISFKERGFYPLKEICKDLNLKRKEISYINQLSQKNKNKQEREKMKDNFKLKSEFNKEDKILLLDDVIVSGSSLLGAYNLLKPRVKKVEVIALAKRKERAFISKILC